MKPQFSNELLKWSILISTETISNSSLEHKSNSKFIKNKPWTSRANWIEQIPQISSLKCF